MKKLIDIKQYVQNIAEVIQSVVDVDVTIIDSDNVRIAATGKYQDKIGSKGVDRSVFLKAMQSKESYVIKNPRLDHVCTDCGNKEECIEFAELCSPILLNDTSIGVIGLVALSEKQRDNLLKNSSNLLNFLKKMGDLLGSKLIETEILEKEKVIHKQIETIINSVDDGIIAIDDKCKVLFVNKRITDLEAKSKEKGIVYEILNRIDSEAIIKGCNEIKNKHLYINEHDFLYTAKPIELDYKIIGYIIILRTIKEINRIINDVSTSFIKTTFTDIIGESSQLNQVKELSMKACVGDSTILISGESGTGKEMFARAIHFNSSRRDKPFIAINCAAIPENLLESELFGYEEGSFTGAKKGGKIGKFELGNGGTIFLDEIGDMPLHLQTKLLRVIQERCIERVGSITNTKIDIRIIAATHKDLNSMVAQGEFRRDLFYRLNVIPIKIPALRERISDIEILAKYFLSKCNIKLDKKVKGLSDEVIDIFSIYSWPGNIREMENVVEYAVNMENAEMITMSNLPARFREKKKIETAYDLKTIEKITILEVLAKYPNRNKAAQMLGLGRATLFRKIREYGIESQIDT